MGRIGRVTEVRRKEREVVIEDMNLVRYSFSLSFTNCFEKCVMESIADDVQCRGIYACLPFSLSFGVY